jgi:hypothetical protein
MNLQPSLQSDQVLFHLQDEYTGPFGVGIEAHFEECRGTLFVMRENKMSLWWFKYNYCYIWNWVAYLGTGIHKIFSHLTFSVLIITVSILLLRLWHTLWNWTESKFPLGVQSLLVRALQNETEQNNFTNNSICQFNIDDGLCSVSVLLEDGLGRKRINSGVIKRLKNKNSAEELYIIFTCWGLFVTYKTVSGLDDWIYWPLIHSTRDYRQYSAIADLHTLQFTVTHTIEFLVFASRILATDF